MEPEPAVGVLDEMFGRFACSGELLGALAAFAVVPVRHDLARADFDDLAQETGAHERWPQDLGAEGGPADRGTAAGGEHQTAGAGWVAALLLGEQVDDEPVPGDRWFVDETYVKIAGQWVYLYRAIDQFGQVVDVLVSKKRDLVATRWFFDRALKHGSYPTEVNTDRAPAYVRVL
jgi:hypothetical protein